MKNEVSAMCAPTRVALHILEIAKLLLSIVGSLALPWLAGQMSFTHVFTVTVH
ncbi:hypothetical protein [Undibacterium sp. Ji42W]|uniref:hypothetical protein n=1 Tax=Undibacterium sp. Ji42W TaxID=3413039 RepID=UPI003BF52F43